MRNNTRGSVGQEYLVAVFAIALVGLGGLTTLGHGFEEAVAGATHGTSVAPESQGASVAAQAGLSSFFRFNTLMFETADHVDDVAGKFVRRRSALAHAQARIHEGERMAREAVANGRGRGVAGVAALVPSVSWAGIRGVGMAGAVGTQLVGRVIGSVKRGAFAIGHDLKVTVGRFFDKPGEYRNVLGEMLPKQWHPQELLPLSKGDGGILSGIGAGIENLGIRWQNNKIRVNNAIGDWYNRPVTERAQRLVTNANDVHVGITDGLHKSVVGPAIVFASKVTKYPHAAGTFVYRLNKLPGGAETALELASKGASKVVDFANPEVRGVLADTEVGHILKQVETEWDTFRAKAAEAP